MKLARIVFAGALLFGVGCELPEEGELATEPRVDPTNLEDSTDHALDELDAEILAPEYASDDSMAPSSDVSEAMVDDRESTVDEENDVLGGKPKKVKCCYCYDEDEDHECDDDEVDYCAKAKKAFWAREKAWQKCEAKHDDGCEFDYCKKAR